MLEQRTAEQEEGTQVGAEGGSFLPAYVDQLIVDAL